MLPALLLVCLVSPSSGLQDLQQTPALPKVAGPTASPGLGGDGEPLVPGQLPPATTPLAQERFAKLNRSTWFGDKAPKPLNSFMVTFDARVRTTSTGTNDMRTTFMYLEEGRGFVRGIFLKSGRESVRGPDGDWLLDGTELLDLSEHSNRESRREHERWLALARNFATLSSPGALRMKSLEALDAQVVDGEVTIGEALPIQFPTAAHAKSASQLEWLVMTTPDFDLLSAQGKGSPLRRVRLGLDPKTGLVRFALVESLGAIEVMTGRNAPILVEIKGWITLGNRLLPKQMLVHRSVFLQGPKNPLNPIAPATRLRFEERPGVDLFLVKNLSHPDAHLTPGNFAKPTPR